MRNLVLLFCLVLSAQFSSAQILPNWSFENWESRVITDLESYETSAYWSYGINGMENCRIDSSGVIGFGVSLTTIAADRDTAFGYLINGEIDDLSGGQTYQDRPDSLVGRYRYNIAAGDTGIILMSFRHDTTENAAIMHQITGSQASYLRFSVPISWNDTLNPDSLIFAAASSNAISEIGITPGSELFLDELRLIASNGDTLSELFNQSFENWISDTTLLPELWSSSSEDFYAKELAAVKRSDSSQNGQYSAVLETSFYDGDTILGIVANYDFRSQHGGSPYDKLTDTLTGYYQYSTSGNDSGFVYIRVFNQTDTIEIGTNLEPASSFTYFEIPISMLSVPDTIQVAFVSSADDQFTTDGSRFWIDNLKFKSCQVPDTPSVITGPNQFCSVSGSELLLYHIQRSGNVDHYDWSIGANASIQSLNDVQDSIYASRNNFPSIDTVIELSVRGVNFCGSSAYSTKLIQLDSMPSKPVIALGTNDSLKASSMAESYRWFHQGIELSANTQTIKAAKSGSYQVLAIHGACSSDTSDAYSFVRSSLESTNQSEAILIYPNPAQTILQLRGLNSNAESKIQLFSLLNGNLATEYFVTGRKTELDVSHLARGMYIVVIISETATQHSKLILK